jgi:hypothetical protein
LGAFQLVSLSLALLTWCCIADTVSHVVYFVGVKDVAVLHIAATLDVDVKDERMQAWVRPFNWNDVLAMWRKQYPNRQFVEDLPKMGKVNHRIDDTLQKQLLKKWNGQDGWINMEDGFKEATESLIAAEEGRL